MVTVGCVSAIAGLLAIVAPAGPAGADQNEPMASCPPYWLAATSPVTPPDGPFATIADDFSVPRGDWWCNANMPTGTSSWGPEGLKLSIPAYPTIGSTLWTNAEVVSLPRVQTGMSMSVRLDAMHLDGVQGSRGWGFWNERIGLGEAAEALFVYQNGTTCPGTECPKGLFALTMARGNPNPKLIPLPTSLLSQAHTYTVTLRENAVDYYVDGVRVARVTDPAYIPTTPMVSHMWVDNMFYQMGGPAEFDVTTLAPQWNARPTEMTARWWWQGPSKRVPMGTKMVSANTNG